MARTTPEHARACVDGVANVHSPCGPVRLCGSCFRGPALAPCGRIPRTVRATEHQYELEAVAKPYPGWIEPAGRSQTASNASPMTIARTDTKTAAAATHHCQSARRPLPGGITTENLTAVGKRRLKALFTRRRPTRDCQSRSQLGRRTADGQLPPSAIDEPAKDCDKRTEHDAHQESGRRVQSDPFRGAPQHYSRDRSMWPIPRLGSTREPRAHQRKGRVTLGVRRGAWGRRPKSGHRVERTPAVKTADGW